MLVCLCDNAKELLLPPFLQNAGCLSMEGYLPLRRAATTRRLRRGRASRSRRVIACWAARQAILQSVQISSAGLSRTVRRSWTAASAPSRLAEAATNWLARDRSRVPATRHGAGVHLRLALAVAFPRLGRSGSYMAPGGCGKLFMPLRASYCSRAWWRTSQSLRTVASPSMKLARRLPSPGTRRAATENWSVMRWNGPQCHGVVVAAVGCNLAVSIADRDRLESNAGRRPLENRGGTA